MKKIVTIGVLIGLLSGILPVFPAKNAEAAVPVFDPAQIALQFAKNAWDIAWQNLITIIIEQIKRQLLNQIVQQIINWVGGGGTPKFITDFEGFFRDAFNFGLQNALIELDLLNTVCTPFRDITLYNISLSAAPSARATVSCPNLGINSPGFYNNFRVGGWEGYLASYLPEGNFYWDALLADVAITERSSAQAGAAEAESIAAQGYESRKDCVTDPGDGSVACRVTTPGTNLADIVDRAIAAPIDFLVNSQASGLAGLVSSIISITIDKLITDTLF